MQTLLKLKKTLLLLFILIFAITFFLRDNYRNVDDVDPGLLAEPIQLEIKNPERINFEKDGFLYELTPLFDYEMNALVVHRLVYDNWYSLSKTDSVFPVDFCAIWGSNVEKKIYQSKHLHFDQDMRFCFFNWTQPNINFSITEASNNHLVIEDEKFEKIATKILPGDQISVKGKLVNVEAKNLENPSQVYTWNSSTDRVDTYGGACEVIYVEDLKILKKGNPLIQKLNEISFYGIFAIIILSIAMFFVRMRGDFKEGGGL